MARTSYPNAGGYSPLEDFSQDMERVFDSLLGRTVGTVLRNGNTEKFTPSLDVAETPEGFSVSVDLPGVNPDDVKLEMHDGKLTISGTRHGVTEKGAAEKSDKNFHRVERVSGNFFRVISLPGKVDIEKIDASYEHGVLHIMLPKVAEQQPKKIQIRTN